MSLGSANPVIMATLSSRLIMIMPPLPGTVTTTSGTK